MSSPREPQEASLAASAPQARTSARTALKKAAVAAAEADATPATGVGWKKAKAASSAASASPNESSDTRGDSHGDAAAAPAATLCRRPTTPTCGSIVGFKEEGGTDYYKVKWRPYYDDDDSVASAFASCRLVLSSPARSARLPSSFSCGLSLAQAAREACRKGTAKHRAVGARPRERLCHEPICWALLPYGRGRLSAWPLRRLCCGALFVFGTVSCGGGGSLRIDIF